MTVRTGAPDLLTPYLFNPGRTVPRPPTSVPCTVPSVRREGQTRGPFFLCPHTRNLVLRTLTGGTPDSHSCLRGWVDPGPTSTSPEWGTKWQNRRTRRKKKHSIPHSYSYYRYFMWRKNPLGPPCSSRPFFLLPRPLPVCRRPVTMLGVCVPSRGRNSTTPTLFLVTSGKVDSIENRIT